MIVKPPLPYAFTQSQRDSGLGPFYRLTQRSLFKPDKPMQVIWHKTIREGVGAPVCIFICQGLHTDPGGKQALEYGLTFLCAEREVVAVTLDRGSVLAKSMSVWHNRTSDQA